VIGLIFAIIGFFIMVYIVIVSENNLMTAVRVFVSAMYFLCILVFYDLLNESLNNLRKEKRKEERILNHEFPK